MRILMLNPPFFKRYSRQSRSPCVTKGGTFYYPYFLAYATGILEKYFEVKLIDAVASDWGSEETVEFAKSFSPALVVLDTSTPSIYSDVEIASRIKEALPETHINLVGTHPTALPGETLNLGKADSVCRGEFEYTVRDLAFALRDNKSLVGIDGLSFKENRIYHNKPRELIKNLDELPFVSEVYKKHLNIRDYFYASLTYPQVTILTARGCPYSCSFCNIPFKNSYRARSIENVVEEFEYIQNELPEIKEVMIEDETFAANKKRTIELCNLMIKQGIKLTWSCNVRVNTDYETLKAMRSAGCRLLCVGFESPTQEALDSVNKKTTKQLQLEFMENARKTGLLVNGCFMLGLIGDTKETIAETIEFAKELNPYTAQFYPLMVYPGTEAYEWAKKNSYLITEDYSRWLTGEGLHSCVLSRPELTDEELIALCDEARRQFYLRPRYLFSTLGRILTNPWEAKRVVKSSRTFFKHLFRGTK
ncbi:MAG: radical SAM protein [Candidatus Hydrothermarchaeota archaeon]|nr:radical SAM protein [Candidatus Hydrothermarchaeota archaeon]